MQMKNYGKRRTYFHKNSKIPERELEKALFPKKDLIIDSVENRIFDDERRKILTFLEKQDNLFAKIENNINQIAKIANTQKFISRDELKSFGENLKTIIELKEQQNEIFTKIYSLIANKKP